METKLKMDLSAAPWRECDCGGMLFTGAMMIKKVSALMSPDGVEHNIPVEVIICNSCQLIPSFMHETAMGIPDNVKAKKKIL